MIFQCVYQNKIILCVVILVQEVAREFKHKVILASARPRHWITGRRLATQAIFLALG